MKLFFHKWYVFFTSVYNIIKAIYSASDKIAALRVELISQKDLDELEKALMERFEEFKKEHSEKTEPLDTIPPEDLN